MIFKKKWFDYYYKNHKIKVLLNINNSKEFSDDSHHILKGLSIALALDDFKNKMIKGIKKIIDFDLNLIRQGDSLKSINYLLYYKSNEIRVPVYYARKKKNIITITVLLKDVNPQNICFKKSLFNNNVGFLMDFYNIKLKENEFHYFSNPENESKPLSFENYKGELSVGGYIYLNID